MSSRLSFEERLDRCTIPLLMKLYRIIIEKQSTLCVAADFDSIEPTIRLVEKIGPHICILKLHTEFHLASRENLIENLTRLYVLKKKYNFLLFEDRKFADGGQTTSLAFKGIVKYVDIVTVWPIIGDEIFKAIDSTTHEANLPEDEPRGCFALCELSFKGVAHLNNKELLEIAQRNSPICIGIIAQKLNAEDRISMIKATPGVNLSQSKDGKGQQWRGPDDVVADGADVIIVGRGITGQHEDQWESVARMYKEKAFESYLKALA